MPRQYKLTLEMLGQKYNSAGATIEDAFSAIPLEWEKVKGRSVVTITKGEKSHEQAFNIVQLRRIMNNKIVRGMWAKRFLLYL